MKFLFFLTFIILISGCSSNKNECKNSTFEWTNLDKNYTVKFFRAYQFNKSEIDYTRKSCSDFLKYTKYWTELSAKEIKILQNLITDSENWERFTSETDKQKYLYAGFAVFDNNKCLVAKIDLVEATNRFLFYPGNKITNLGYIHYNGSLLMDQLYDNVENRIPNVD